MKDVNEYSVKWTYCDSNRECLKFDRVGKPSSSTIITANNFINTVHHIKKMYCQQFTLKYITLFTKSFRPNQFYHRAGMICYIIPSVFVTNTQSFLQQARKWRGIGGRTPLKYFVSSWKNVLDKIKNYWT